jgi:hypothetical protein
MMGRIPHTIPLADENHPLAIFSGNPTDHINANLDDWEDILNPMIHRAFGYGATVESEQVLAGLGRRGQYGLDGFYQFMDYFVVHRGLQGGLLEGKVNILLAVINFECMT